jgi:hypothetical protein
MWRYPLAVLFALLGVFGPGLVLLSRYGSEARLDNIPGAEWLNVLLSFGVVLLVSCICALCSALLIQDAVPASVSNQKVDLAGTLRHVAALTGSGSHPEQSQQNQERTIATAGSPASQVREITNPAQDENYTPQPSSTGLEEKPISPELEVQALTEDPDQAKESDQGQAKTAKPT